ncbi:sirohydrochlorin chelatase [Thiorhodococcus fuscus]|uniref:Sirohydrochlorin chelatase n=1 Tax=Thiorhodococcus fuscus TaxID=527200 RepID=A0ABW4Y3W3_9GAMM
MRRILLVDNGSKRAESTLNLRRIAALLSERTGEPVQPVSLLHSDQIAPERLDGQPTETFRQALEQLLAADQRDLVLLPLFFGPTRALSRFIPESVAEVERRFGPCRLRIAPELCPLPEGEPRLVDILLDNLDQAAQEAGIERTSIVLVDHGSPTPEVNQVRRWLGARLAERLGPDVQLQEAVMERRPGAAYDFNGPLLEAVLDRIARENRGPILLSMLFLGPGRHAGPGGDIRDICDAIQGRHPGLQLHIAPLVGTHPGLIDILLSRFSEAENRPPIRPSAD